MDAFDSGVSHPSAHTAGYLSAGSALRRSFSARVAGDAFIRQCRIRRSDSERIGQWGAFQLGPPINGRVGDPILSAHAR